MKRFSIAVVFAATSLAALASAQSLPKGDGKDVVEKVCTGCHGPEAIVATTGTKAEWTDIVNDMAAKGADMEKDEKEKIIAYLATALPKKSEKKK